MLISAGLDYMQVNDATRFFPIGSVNGNTTCTDVQIIDNMAFEKDEYFSVLVSSESNVGVHSNATVHIFDDEGTSVQTC